MREVMTTIYHRTMKKISFHPHRRVQVKLTNVFQHLGHSYHLQEDKYYLQEVHHPLLVGNERLNMRENNEVGVRYMTTSSKDTQSR